MLSSSKWNKFGAEVITGDQDNSLSEMVNNDVLFLQGNSKKTKKAESSLESDTSYNSRESLQTSKFPDLRPYVCFDDLETCPVDGTQDDGNDDHILAGLCREGRPSKWNMFTGAGVRTATSTSNIVKTNRVKQDNDAKTTDHNMCGLSDSTKFCKEDKENSQTNTNCRNGNSKWNQFVSKENTDINESLNDVISSSYGHFEGTSVSDSNNRLFVKKLTKQDTVKIHKNFDEKLESVNKSQPFCIKPVKKGNMFNIGDLGEDDFDL